MNFVRSLTNHPAGNALLVSGVAFLVYLKTLAPSVTFIDSGELAAVACTLGIAHPTGYPLFTLLGWLFSKLPIASEEIVRLNLMSAFFCALGIFVFYMLCHTVLSRLFSTAKTREKYELVVAIRVASAAAALLLAFSETYWLQATAIEVYALHMLLVMIVLYSFVRAAFGNTDEDELRAPSAEAWWYVFALTLGLSFTNHMTTILLAPGLLYFYFATQGFDSQSWKRIARMAIPFALGFSVYFYLPLRAAQAPSLNWGNPATLEKFLWHWTGKQYRVWIFSSTEAAGRQLKYFFNELPYEFAYIGLIVAALGVIMLFRTRVKVAITIVLLFIGCVAYAINYDIHDIDSYFLLAYIAVALSSAVGFFGVVRWLRDKTNTVVAVTTVLLVGLVPLVVHFDKNNETGNYLVEDYTANMFESFQPNALVLSYQWDFWVSSSYYYQLVKGVRRDVTVVDKELLRRSWYFKQLERSHPWLIENSRTEVEAFLKELHKFEHDIPYNPNEIQARFVEMIRSFIINNISSRPVYVTTEIESEFTASMQRVSEGLALRVYADTVRHEVRPVEFAYREFARGGRLEDRLKDLYANALVAQCLSSIRDGNVEKAVEQAKFALAFNPNSAEAASILRQLKARIR